MGLVTLKVNEKGFFEQDEHYPCSSILADDEPCTAVEYTYGEVDWICEIDEDKRAIRCCATTMFSAAFYEKVLPLRTGVLVLNSPGDEDGYMYASFRTPELQELMDAYGIIAIRNENPNRIHFSGRVTGYGWTSSGGWTSDGQIDEDAVECLVTNASWLLTEVYLYDEERYAYILHTRKKLTPEMAKSFAKHGVQPVH